MKAYLANGLFSSADRMYNEHVAKTLRQAFPELELFVPQEQTINDKNSYADSRMIATADAKGLLESDFLVAILDGVEIDSGVAAEIGIFWTTGRPIIGICTDVRQMGRDNELKIEALIEDGMENQFIYRNLMVIGLVKDLGVVVSDEQKAVRAIRELVVQQ